ncbi:CoA pyrophosphatase [Phanerochaete sordida]|uniref:CoA pyrophosphatase n=1 Tax=Phanerochaete sordida TaxID=48140 RepID=A0A9P3G2Z1_9APHY|nr:CoA pyrophosphatase [Phanerochaete sordida]
MPSRKSQKRSDLLEFHRPQLKFESAPIPPLKPESRRCLHNLAQYDAPKHKLRLPRSRSAAVLVALFVGRQGDLYVLLSQRSQHLRTFPGDTSLPGGKWDEGDRNVEDTARREAFEEIGLPIDKQRVPLLCVAEPFLAGGNLVVTPVVVLMLDNTIRPILNEAEVASLFSHPLASFLSEEAPFPVAPDAATAYHTHHDMRDWVPSGPPECAEQNSTQPARPFRMHRFLTGREASGSHSIKPVYGLTAAILIRVATIGYARKPAFELYAPGQWDMWRRIEHAVRWHPVFREARWRERIVYPGEEEDFEEWRKVHGDSMLPREKPRGLFKGLIARSRL